MSENKTLCISNKTANDLAVLFERFSDIDIDPAEGVIKSIHANAIIHLIGVYLDLCDKRDSACFLTKWYYSKKIERVKKHISKLASFGVDLPLCLSQNNQHHEQE